MLSRKEIGMATSHSFSFCFLDLNTASEEEIGSIPLVGPTHARLLVENRPFRDMEEVTRLPGLSPEQVNALTQAGAVVGAQGTELRA